MDWKAIVGANVRKARIEKDITQEELAHLAGLTSGYVSQVERGRRNLSVEAMGKLAEALGVEMERLVRRK